MKVTTKTWTTLGLATALAGAGLAGCSGEAGSSGEGGEAAQSGEAGAGGEGEGGEGAGGEGEGGEAGAAGALPIENRAVFMAGHVEAGLALYRAGEAEMAAPHLLHPVSETHQAERAGLDKLGFDPAPFEAVSAALENGKPASEVEPQLQAAGENLVKVLEAAGGDPVAQIRFLMETTIEEYNIAVPDGTVTDPGEYQDSWGFVMIAKDLATDLEAPKADAIRATLDEMLALWPDAAPIPPENPAPKGQVSALASRVMLDLPTS